MTNFVALGQRLREAREAKELSPDDVERATRIRARFIEQMERGDYAGMTPVQAQGFLRNYARFLGIDFDLLASELTGAESKGVLGRARREPQPTSPPAAPTRSMTPRPAARAEGAPRKRRRGWLTSTAIVLIAGAIVVLVVLGATALLDSLSESAGDEGVAALDLTPDGGAEPGPESGGETDSELLAAGDTEATPTEGSVGPITPELAYTPPGDTSTHVVVSINVTQRTWLRVTVDGEVTRQGLARPGEVWQFEGEESVGLRASNAAALALSVNNQRQGALGSRGQLFDQTFTREGLAGPPAPEPTSAGAAPDTLSSNPASVTATASPEQAALVLSPTLDPSAPLPSGDEDGLIAPLASATPELPSPEAPTPEPPTPEPATPEPPTRVPASATRTPAPPSTPTARPSATSSATASATASLAPSATLSPTTSPTRTPTSIPSWTPTLTVTPTATATASATPFLPPRLTRTPTVSPK